MSEAEPAVPPEHPGREGPEQQFDPEEVRRATLLAVALRPGAKARAAGLALSLCGALTTLCAGLGLYFLQTGQGARALGLFLGHVGAQLVTVSWIAGAVLTFDRESHDFMRATLGASPLRFVILGTIVGLGLWLTEPDQPALFFSLMLTHVAGHVIEYCVLERLKAERVQAEGPPPQSGS
jgi:hypothetical protein